MTKAEEVYRTAQQEAAHRRRQDLAVRRALRVLHAGGTPDEVLAVLLDHALTEAALEVPA